MSKRNQIINVKKDKVYSNLNKLGRFKIVDESGKVVEEFRTKRGADEYLRKNKDLILKIKDDN